MGFRNRVEAGQALSRALPQALAGCRGQDVVVLALPRGGVPVAAEIARALKAPLDLALVRKIGAPFQEELAMGAVADAGEPETVRNEDVIAAVGVDEAGFEAARARELDEMERRRRRYLKDRPRAEVAGKVAIVVDDGVATGATTRAALRAVRRRGPAKLILATPVAPAERLPELRAEADEVVCLEDLRWGAIGLCYDDFRQVEDETVVELLAEFPPARVAPP